ncbi:MAG: hypothetical protein KI785_11100 [Devosiaceae bacterium]|nr:hypothetical protein [Devosiaceae bacterium MH13]
MKHLKTSLAAFALAMALPVTVPTAPAMATGLMDCWGLQGAALEKCSKKVADELACQVNEELGNECPGTEETTASPNRMTIQPVAGTTQRPARQAR